MGLSYRSRRGLAAGAYAALAWLMCLPLAVGVEVVKKAAGVPDNAAGVGRFINGAKALVVPMLAMTAAVAPLAIIVGGLSLLFGGRRGLQIMGTALGVLLVLGS